MIIDICFGVYNHWSIICIKLLCSFIDKILQYVYPTFISERLLTFNLKQNIHCSKIQKEIKLLTQMTDQIEAEYSVCRLCHSTVDEKDTVIVNDNLREMLQTVLMRIVSTYLEFQMC